MQEWSLANPQVYGPSSPLYNSPNHIAATGWLGDVGQPKACWDRFTTRHSHGGHVLFADGHVSFYPWPDVQVAPSVVQQYANPGNWDFNHYGDLRWIAWGR